jgi:hypothetical protein
LGRFVCGISCTQQNRVLLYAERTVEQPLSEQTRPGADRRIRPALRGPAPSDEVPRVCVLTMHASDTS